MLTILPRARFCLIFVLFKIIKILFKYFKSHIIPQKHHSKKESRCKNESHHINNLDFSISLLNPILWKRFYQKKHNHKIFPLNPDTNTIQILTYNIKKCEKLTKEISISPPIMIFQIIIQIIKKEFFLLFLFYFRYYTDV